MFNKKKPDVLIVGAGPVGMATALMLIQRGLKVDVVDKLNDSCAHSNSFLLSPAVLEVFDKLGLINDVLADAQLIDKIEIYDERKRKAVLSLGELNCRYPFIASLPLSRLEALLMNALAAVDQPVKWNHRFAGIEMKDGQLKVEVDRLSEHFTGYAVMHDEVAVDKVFTYYPKWVIGADGYNSVVRNMMNLEYPLTGKMQDYLVFEYYTKPVVNNRIRISIYDDLLASQCPLPHDKTRFSFEVHDLDLPDDFRSKCYGMDACENAEFLNDRQLKQLISKRIPWGSPEITRLSWRIGLPFGAHTATSFYQDGVFLIGDAAHSGCPISMKGLNMGILESDRIADAILKHNPQRGDIDFEKIEYEMRNEWLMTMTLGHHSRPMMDTDAWIHKHCGKILKSLPVTGIELEALALQLKLELAFAPLVTS